jgi:hypothetical protein
MAKASESDAGTPDDDLALPSLRELADALSAGDHFQTHPAVLRLREIRAKKNELERAARRSHLTVIEGERLDVRRAAQRV